MDYVIMGGQLVLSLCILIILHEMGHFLPARWFKTRAEKFYLFFDPWFSLIKAKKIQGKWQFRSFLNKNQSFENDDESKTEWGVGWLPLGGYVKIAGMVDESFDREQLKQEPKPWEFRSKPAWQRLIIMLGGVTVNFILGFLLMGFILWNWGEEYLPAENALFGIYADSLGKEMGLQNGDKIIAFDDKPFVRFSDREMIRAIVIDGAKTVKLNRSGQEMTLPIDPKYVSLLASYDYKDKRIFEPLLPNVIGRVSKDFPAEKAGLKVDDHIIALNNQPTPFYQDFAVRIREYKNQEVSVTFVRNERDTSVLKITTTEDGRIGYAPFGPDKFFEFKSQKYGLLAAIPAGVKKGWGFITDQVKALGKIFSGKIKASESLGGFGTFAKLFPTTWDWKVFWNITAIISLILAIMNLLPIPALDGGHVMFLLWEVVTGRKPNEKIMEIATTAGFILILALIVYVNGLDIMRGCG